MIEHIKIPQPVIDRAIEQLEIWHGGSPNSIVWAIAHERYAQRIRTKVEADQIEISGLKMEIPQNAARD